MNKGIAATIIAIGALFALSACGKPVELKELPGAVDTQQAVPMPETIPTTEAIPTIEATATVETTPRPLSPYNWLGYPEMPRCVYLDALCAQHYYCTFSRYFEFSASGSKIGPVDYTLAVDDKNKYENDGNTESYTLQGWITVVNHKGKNYRELDMTGFVAGMPSAEELASKNVNNSGKEFQGTSNGPIPLLDGIDGDSYAYYEYLTKTTPSLLERLYLKNGDVYAIYTEAAHGEKDCIKQTAVYKSITMDIPAGVFELPNLSEYKME